MADEKTGLLIGQVPSAPPDYSQTMAGYGSEQGGAGHPQTGQSPSQQAGQYPPPQGGYYPPPQGGYYPPPQGGQHPQQGYYSQQAQTYVVAAPQPQTMIIHPPPEDYMNRAIFAALCCFCPLGIFAICKASDARQALARGDIAGAQASSESARMLSNISIIAGILSIVVVCIIVGVSAGIFANKHY